MSKITGLLLKPDLTFTKLIYDQNAKWHSRLGDSITAIPKSEGIPLTAFCDDEYLFKNHLKSNEWGVALTMFGFKINVFVGIRGNIALFGKLDDEEKSTTLLRGFIDILEEVQSFQDYGDYDDKNFQRRIEKLIGQKIK